MRYHAFISYSSAVDKHRAGALQRSLERLARPWYKVRSGLHIFRDDTDLPVSHRLDKVIYEGLAESEWLVLLACPESARSEWVGKEVSWWLQHRSIDRLLLVKTGGTLTWNENSADFDSPDSSALTSALHSRFESEPLYADLSGLDGHAKIDIHNGILRPAAIKIAARLLGRSPALVESEDLSQVRRNKIWAACAVLLIVCAAAVAGWQWREAKQRADQLLTEGLRARSNELYGNAEAAHTAGADELAMVLAHYALATDPGNRGASLRAVAALARSPAVMTLRGHEHEIVSVAFSANGRQLVTASKDGTARVWDVARGVQSAVLKGHKGGLTSAVFSPDDQWVLTAGTDTTVRLWDSATGKELQVLRGHDSVVSQAMFSQSGRQAVSASSDYTARIWTLDGTQAPATLEAQHVVIEGRFSPDGRYVVTRGADPTPLLWLANGTQRFAFSGHKSRVLSVAFTPDSRRVLSITEDGAALWDIATATLARQFKSPDDQMIDGALTPDGSRLATLGASNQVLVWDVATGKSISTLRGRDDTRLNSVSFSSKGFLLASRAKDDSALIWDTTTGNLLAQFRGHTGGLTALEFGAGDALVATGSIDGTARLWQVDTNPLLLLLRADSERLASARFSGDGSRILATTVSGGWQTWRLDRPSTQDLVRPPLGRGELVFASPNGERLVWVDPADMGHLVAAENGRLVARFAVREGPTAVTFSPDGQRLAARNEGLVRVWSAADGTLLSTLDTGGMSVQSVAFDRAGRRIVTCDGDDQPAKLWDVDHGRLLAELKGSRGPCRAVFKPDDTEVMIFGEDGATGWWAAVNGEPRRELGRHHGAVRMAAYSARGDMALTVGVDRTVRIWDVRTGRAVTLIRGHSAGINSAEFSPDGSLVLTASADGSARVWDTAQGIELIKLRSDGREMVEAHFDAQGLRVLTLGEDGAARLWDVSLSSLSAADLLVRSRQRLAALSIETSAEQCQLYFVSSIGQRPPECAR